MTPVTLALIITRVIEWGDSGGLAFQSHIPLQISRDYSLLAETVNEVLGGIL